MDASSDNLEPVELLADEFMERQRRGEQPSLDEYVDRYPELADEIREVFPALAVIEQVAPHSADLVQSDPATDLLNRTPLERVGNYRILRLIGRGGMGVVYEAEQESLGRRVALKVLPRQAAGDAKSLLRFQREARAAARMHHTNIVPVFEVGQDDEHVFYAMQLIQGQSLDHVVVDLRQLRSDSFATHDEQPQKADSPPPHSLAASLMVGRFEQQNLVESDSDITSSSDRPDASAEDAYAETVLQAGGSTVSAALPGQSELSTAESNRTAFYRSVAEIGLQTARALSYAHARGIIHRDIKPSNLLLDGTGVVWVTDFGLAHTGDGALTHTGDILGTIRYMSPERFRGQCDVRADIYSLGLTLYELLTLKPAFESPDRLKLIDLVKNAEPPSLRSLDSRIPRDLETIVLKSIDKDPKRRYQSADELADDLQHFVHDEPIKARRISSIERFVRWTRRNPGLATATSFAAVALIAVAILSSLFAKQQADAATQQSRLNTQLTESNTEQKRLNERLTESIAQRNMTIEQRDEVIEQLQASQARLAERQARYDIEKGDLVLGMQWFARSYELAPDENVALREDVLSGLSLAAGQLPPLQAVWSRPPVNLPSSRDLSRWAVEPTEAFSPDRTLLALFTTGEADPEKLGAGPKLRQQSTPAIQLWNVSQGEPHGRPLIVDEGVPTSIVISPDNRRVAAILTEPHVEQTSVADRLVVWDVASGKLLFEPRPVTPADALHFVLRLLQLLQNRNASLWFNSEGTRVKVIGTSLPDGRTGPVHADVHTCDAGTGEELDHVAITIRKPSQLPPLLAHAGLSPDGSKLLVTSFDVASAFAGIGNTAYQASVTRYDLETGEPVEKPIRLLGGWWMLTPITSDAQQVAICTRRNRGRDHRVEVWDFGTGQRIAPMIDPAAPVTAMAVSDEGGRVLLGTGGPEADLLEFTGALGLRSGRGRRSKAASMGDGQVRMWDIGTGKPLTPPILTDCPPEALSFVTGGLSFAACDGQSVRTWEMPRARLHRALLPGTTSRGRPPLPFLRMTLARRTSVSRVLDGALAYLSSGEIVMARQAAGSGAVEITRWDSKEGRLREKHVLPETADAAARVFAPRGERLVTQTITNAETTIRCWRTDVGERIGQPIQISHPAVALAVTSNGSYVAVLELPLSEEERAELQASQGLGSSPDESIVGNLRVWDVMTGQPAGGSSQSLSLQNEYPVVRFGPAGRTLAYYVGQQGRLWNLNSGDVTPMPPLAESVQPTGRSGTFFRTTAFGPAGRLLAITSDDQTVVVINLADGQPIGMPLEHAAAVSAIAFHPDGRGVATACEDGIVRQWSLPVAWSGQPSEITARVETLTGLRLDEQDVPHLLSPEAFTARRRLFDEETFAAEKPDLLSHQESRALELVAARDASATQGLDRWIAQRPADWQPYVFRVRAHIAKDRFDEARGDLDRALALADRRTVAYWLQNELFRIDSTSPRRLRPDLREASQRRARWYCDQLIRTAVSDEARAEYMLKRLGLLRDPSPEQEIEVLTRVLDNLPDSHDLRIRRARLYEHLFQWDKAVADYQTALAAAPEEHYDRYHLGTTLLYKGDVEPYRQLCHAMLAKWGDSTEPRIRERTAKLCLLLPVDGDDFETALRLIDEAYENDREGTYGAFDVLSKGIAEYRRGRCAKAIEHFDKCIPMFDERGNYQVINAAVGDLFAAMAHHQLEETDTARQRFAAAVQRIDEVYFEYIRTREADGHAWMMAEIARREAQRRLGVSEDEFGLELADTTGWTLLFDDNFDRDEVGKKWRVNSGEWAIENGALVGTLTARQFFGFKGARIRLSATQIPDRVEIQFDTWWPEPTVMDFKLMNANSSHGYIAGLSGVDSPSRRSAFPDEPGTGPQMLIKDQKIGTASYTFIARDPQIELEPNHHYHVRVVRQPRRLTLFLDDEQVFSERVYELDAPVLQLYGFGPAGSKVFFDNLRVRVPPQDAPLQR